MYLKFLFIPAGLRITNLSFHHSTQFDTQNKKIQSFHELVAKEPTRLWTSEKKAEDLLIEVTIPEFLEQFISWKSNFQLIELAIYTFKSGSHLHAAAVHELSLRMPGVTLLSEFKAIAAVMTEEEKVQRTSVCYGHIHQLQSRAKEAEEQRVKAAAAAEARIKQEDQEQPMQIEQGSLLSSGTSPEEQLKNKEQVDYMVQQSLKTGTSSVVAGATPKSASVSSDTSAVAMELSNFTSNFTSNFASIIAKNNEQLLRSIMTMNGNNNTAVGDFGRNTMQGPTQLPLAGAPGTSRGPDHLVQRPSVGHSMYTPKTQYFNIGTPSETPCCYATPLSLPSSIMGNNSGFPEFLYNQTPRNTSMSTTNNNQMLLSDDEIQSSLLAVGIPLEVQRQNTKEYNAEQLHKLHVFCLGPSNEDPFASEQPAAAQPAGSDAGTSSAVIVSRPGSPMDGASDYLGGSAPAGPLEGTTRTSNFLLQRSTTRSAPEQAGLTKEESHQQAKYSVVMSAEELAEYNEMKRRRTDGPAGK